MMRIVLFSLLLLAPALAHAERVAVLPVSGVNLHEGYLQAAQDLLRVHLEGTGRYDVVMIDGPHGAREVSPQDAMAQAQAAGAQIAVVVHVTRLGSSARIRLVAYDPATGRIVQRDELAAGSPEDIDPALERLAKAMATGKRAADTADIYTVTEKEADPLRKQATTSVFGLKIGALVPVSSAGEGEPAMPGAGIFWLYDVRTFLAELAADFHLKDGNGDFTIGLGAYYPFSQNNTTGYLGGGLRYGWVNLGNGDSGAGVAFHATAGLLVGRLSTVQLRAEVAFFMNTFTESDIGGVETRANGVVVSGGLGF